MASDIKKSVLIIGAGPAGLTLAYELLSRSDQFDVTVLEKQEIVGGLAQTYNHKGNRIDIGGHRFFSKDQRVMDRWFAQMSLQGSEAWDYKKLGITSEVAPGGPDPDKEDVVMLARRRLSRIFWNRKFFDYPLSITRDTISKFGLADLVQSGLSYVAAKFKTYDMTNLEGFYKSRFGERLYDRFFNAYTHKVRGKWPKDISSARGAQRVKGLNLGKAVRDYFKKMIIGDRQSTKTETSLIGKFYYPKLGPGQMWEVVAQRIQDLGGKIIFGADFAGGFVASSDNNTLPTPQKTQGLVDNDHIDIGDGIVAMRATQADVEEAEALRQAAWVESYGNEGIGITSEMIQKRFAGKSEQNIALLSNMVAEGKHILVVKHDNKIIGLKYPPRSDKGRWRVGAIYLLKKYTGKGLGTKLMNISLKDVRDKDLYCEVAEYNKNTIQFYERLGFHIEPNEQSQTIEFENGAVLKTIVMKRPGTQNKISHTIQSISYTKDGQTVTVQPDIVVSTAPIKELMTRFDGVDPEVVRLSNLLEYRDFITVGILAKKLLVENTSNHKTINNIIPDNRLYIHDKGTTVGRIQVFNNWSPYMVADPDTIWIGLEYFCNKSDDIRNMSDENMIEFAVKELESMKLLDRANYLDGVVRRMEYTYPCYFGEGYDKFDHIKTYLDSVTNLYCVGRNGAHRYNNQDHSMLSSMKLADMLISGNVDRSILRSVNTEEEYHEGGKK